MPLGAHVSDSVTVYIWPCFTKDFFFIKIKLDQNLMLCHHCEVSDMHKLHTFYYTHLQVQTLLCLPTYGLTTPYKLMPWYSVENVMESNSYKDYPKESQNKIWCLNLYILNCSGETEKDICTFNNFSKQNGTGIWNPPSRQKGSVHT